MVIASVTHNDNTTVPYTITLLKNTNKLRLSDGVETEFVFPDKWNEVHFFYYPQRIEELTIVSVAKKRESNLYLNVFDSSSSPDQSTWVYPTAENHEFGTKQAV
mmetsp:Transcript_23308/g.20200  ORF Transcript_23308/g.20200 Transcript_23308/m.20200 type:complete len:104 (+) Transcript_23308:1469-1780(+)